MSKIKTVSIDDIECVAHNLAQETLGWDEPIPHFATRFPYVLEKCVATVFQTYNRKSLYSGFLKQVAVLFYLMIKNHPFQNGNKRIAMTATIYFIYKNGKWIEVDNQELYNFAKWVAESNSKLKDETVAAIEKFFQNYIVKRDV
jgi:death-on-curing family protein